VTLGGGRIWITVLAFAVLIRLVAAPFTGHPYDLAIWMATGKYVASGGSPYDLHPSIGYPPLWALWCGLSYAASNFISPGNFFAYIFAIKLPILLGDFAVALMLVEADSRWSSRNQPLIGRKLAVLYLLNPYVLVVGVVWGMMDNLVAVCVVASMLALYLSKPGWSGILLASAVAFKLYPIMFLPLMAAFLIRRRQLKNIMTYAFGFLAASFLTISLPFIVFGWDAAGLLRVAISQVAFRNPAAIAPMAVFPYLVDLGITKLGPVSIENFYRDPLLHAVWIPALCICLIVILRRRMFSSSLGTMVHEYALVYMVYLLFAPSVSEQLFELVLIFMLFSGAFAGMKRSIYVSYVIGSIIVFAVLSLHVPVTSFLFPVYQIDRAPLVRLGGPLLPWLVLVFAFYLVVQIAKEGTVLRSARD